MRYPTKRSRLADEAQRGRERREREEVARIVKELHFYPFIETQQIPNGQVLVQGDASELVEFVLRHAQGRKS